MYTHEQIKTLALDLLRELGSCPAVSFMEGAVADCIRGSLQGTGLSVEQDGYGNLIARNQRHSAKGESNPPIAFMAHMDHPG
ncbi:MAG: hypothetical protein J4F46_10820, partial [Dehalococcoidia bacterium]|nr:hypothetical protein [Dehalococcoidia bacterium]